MKILAHVHQAPPVHNAGAEWAVQALLARLAEAHGHEVCMMTNRPPRRDDMVGAVKVVSGHDNSKQREKRWAWADVVITHLDATPQAIFQQRSIRRPLVHYAHNHSQLSYHGVKPANCQLLLTNSQWVMDSMQWPGDQMVVYPPVWPDRMFPPDWNASSPERPPGDHDRVLLMNTNLAKGAEIFYDLATNMPDVEFVCVKGAYGAQMIRKMPNVAVVSHTDLVWLLYAAAKVLLMPSSYESWGRTAVEAAWCHVPTLAAITPGLVETEIPWRYLAADAAQGDGYSLGEWVDALRVLLGDKVNALAGAQARARAEQLDTICKVQIAELSDRLEAL